MFGAFDFGTLPAVTYALDLLLFGSAHAVPSLPVLTVTSSCGVQDRAATHCAHDVGHVNERRETPTMDRSRRFYAPYSFWNQPIPPDAPVDPNSANIVATGILPYASRATFANDDDWGIGLVHASRHDKIYTIACLRYYCDGPVRFRIPKSATPTSGSDHHLTVIEGDRELDMWDASYDAADDRWSAGSRFIGALYGWGANAPPGKHAGGAVAAGFSEMGGVVRPEEIAQGHVDHALSMMIPHPRIGHVGPATAADGRSRDRNALPEGAHIQLDPAFDVDAQDWPTWEKIIARALQKYGAFVSDTGGAIALYGQTDVNAGNLRWASIGTPKGGSLANLPWDRVRVLNLSLVPSDLRP